MTQPRIYRYSCSFTTCNTLRRDGDVFCGPHYHSLPQHMKSALYAKEVRAFQAAVTAAKKFIQDKIDNALIVHEDGP